MSNKVIDFPQYRKLSNDKVFYRIISDRKFDEIQVIGKTAQLHKIEAKQYPEMLRIKDLLALSMSGFEASTKEEFDNVLNRYSL
ncbi:MAG: hypothetical protein JKY09_06195 [Crocinitomicaceae bacterium]|nr:hypothetical protein [Crocinitomicaceae bacterium]